jgi:Protein of unknown function (DUF3071)
MQELRFVAVSEDGQYAVLGVPGRSARFTLPIDERLRAVALGQTSRLAQYEIEVESPLRPKEIQARIRAGETVEEIADAAGIAVERVRWFEGPVLAERAYMADQAQQASVRRQGDATPGPRLGEIVAERMKVFGAEPDDAQWDAKKRGDGSWLVQLAFITGGRLHTAEWIFDPRRRHVIPADDNAARMSLPGAEPPQPAAPLPGEATVTQLAPRLSTASGFGPAGTGSGAMGSGAMGNGLGNGLGPGPGNGGRPRYERPAAARPTVPEPKVTEWEAPQPREAQPREAQSWENQPRETEPRETQPRETQPRETQPRETQPRETQPRETQPREPERRAPEAPAAAAPAVPSAPPASPARVAAQVSRAAAQAAPSSEIAPPARMAPSARHARPAQDSPVAQDSRVAQESKARQQAPQPSAGGNSAPVTPATATSAVPAAPHAPPVEPAAATQPEAASEQTARQGRKAARGKRSSVPSWDEIMFGNSRQRD